jgi:pyruvate,water dikinase
VKKEMSASIMEIVGADQAFVAVRSSVAVKGSQISSFPGMMDTFHYLRGEEEIIAHIKKCWASLWTSRAVYARHHQGIDHQLGIIAPVVQRMVHSEVAGVMFTANPVTGDRDEIVIEANWGLGESVVSGKSLNDFFVVDKKNLNEKTRKISRKTVMVDFDAEKGFGRKECPVPSDLAEEATLSAKQVLELSDTGVKIEELFQHPQDIEWAYEKGKLYFLQSRNIRTLAD